MVVEFPVWEKFSHWNSTGSIRLLMDQSKELGSLQLSNRAVNAWQGGDKNWTAASNSWIQAFVWLRSLQRHWHNHGTSESLGERGFYQVAYLAEAEMSCTPPSPRGHQALTASRPATLLRVPAREVVLLIQTPASPRKLCLSTFQVTVWYTVLLWLNGCTRWLYYTLGHTSVRSCSSLIVIEAEQGACLPKLWKLDLEEGENFALSTFAETINSRRGVESLLRIPSS